jgi:two-component system CheB/CheR fusion protein
MKAKEAAHDNNRALVVIGSSAGGIEALSILVSTLRPDFPASIVLAQHLDPRRPSSLEMILQRRSNLPVVVVDDTTHLKAGTIYVVPSNRHVTVHDSRLSLEQDHGDRPRPSIDLLLSSAAQAFGEHLIAVVLTGSGSDGASGAVDVKNAGGTVVIQNPNTARYPSMPLALPPTAVDHVAELEEMGPLLAKIIQGLDVRQEAPEKVEDPLRDILAQISRKTKIDFRQYKPATILRRINRRMAATHTLTMSDYARYIENHPEEVGELVTAFLIKVTQFFRDKEAFDYLRQDVIPTIIERKRESDKILRFWSAGTATGEEAYSLVLMLADVLGHELSEWNIRIFATDLDEEAINFARRGLYPESTLKDLPADYRTRFFERFDQGYRISKQIRQMVIFGQQDISRGAPFPRIDLVVCRNLLIYFKPELQQTILNMFAYALHQSQGYLFLGHAETVRPSQTNFEMVNKKWKVYRCVAGPLPGVQQPMLPNVPLQLPLPHPGRTERGASAPDRTAAAVPELTTFDTALAMVRRLNDIMLRYLPYGAAVIDRAYRIISVNPAAKRLLGIHELATDQDFLHTVHGVPYKELRTSIDSVFHDRTPVTLPELELNPQLANDDKRFLSMTIAPILIEPGLSDLAVVTIQDVTDAVVTKRNYRLAGARQKKLTKELGSANRQLTDLNKELQDANEELQANYEEMLLTQEELQATNEEFEATNEELQASNEELETSNEELQAANEELETTNEELQARTSELEEMTRTLATEQVRLSEMVELAPFYVMLLRGPALIVEAFNPSYQRLLEGRDTLGRPLEDVFYEPEMTNVINFVREAYSRNETQITPRLPTFMLGDQGREARIRYFVYTIVPSHDSAGKVDGVALFANDVTDLMAYKAEERQDKLKLMVEHADVALGLYDAQTMRLLQASQRYLDILERSTPYERDDLIGRTFDDIAFIAPHDQAAEIFQSVVESRATRRLQELRRKLRRDNSETIWNYSLTPIPAEEGEPRAIQYVAISAVEITEQVRAREELERLDDLKDTFLSMASHELRTPLVPLMGYSQMLEKLVARSQSEDVPNKDERIAEYVSKFHKQLVYLNRLVDDLIDVTRLQSGKLSVNEGIVDVPKLAAEAAEEAQMIAPRPKIRLKIAEGDGPLKAKGDAARILQVMLNLLQNAMKYAPKARYVDVRVGRERVSVDGSGDGDKDQIVIDVQDYGPGIATKDIESIFTRFYQAAVEDRPAESGLGLGLFISKGLVEQHGGTLTVESTVGKGSTFTVRLPAQESDE